jgi:hypothetical protein
VKRLLFAVAVACLFAVNSIAADPPATTTPVTPPVVSGTVIAPTVPTAPAVMTTTGTYSSPRRGLFGRLRNRSMSAPVYSSPATTVAPSPILTPMTPTTAPGIVPAPMPMPGTVRPTETSTTESGVVTAGGGTVVNGAPMPGTVMAAPMMPMTTTMTATTTTTSTRTRMGLLSRLRARR